MPRSTKVCCTQHDLDNVRNFIRTWQTSSSVEEVARRMFTMPSNARQRGALLIYCGVPLKALTCSIQSGYNYAELAELAGSLVESVEAKAA